MGIFTPNKRLYKADPVADAKKPFNITQMLNDNWDKLDAASGFTELSEAPGNKVSQVRTKQGKYDVWTSVITNGKGQEVARMVETQSSAGEGLDKWTTVITIDGTVVKTIVETQTLEGWERVIS